MSDPGTVRAVAVAVATARAPELGSGDLQSRDGILAVLHDDLLEARWQRGIRCPRHR